MAFDNLEDGVVGNEYKRGWLIDALKCSPRFQTAGSMQPESLATAGPVSQPDRLPRGERPATITIVTVI